MTTHRFRWLIPRFSLGNLLMLMVKDGELNLNLEDEVLKGAMVTHDGAVVNEAAKKMMAS